MGEFEDYYNVPPGEVLLRINIRLGTCGSVAELRQAVDDQMGVIAPRADKMMDCLQLADSEREVELVAMTAAGLGLTEFTVAPTAILAAAREQGLELCPAEVGPQFLMQYPYLPFGWGLFIGMNPVKSAWGRAYFTIERDVATYRLHSLDASRDERISRHRCWLFVKPHGQVSDT